MQGSDMFMPVRWCVSLFVIFIQIMFDPKQETNHFMKLWRPSQHKDVVLPVYYLQHVNPRTWDRQSLYWDGAQASTNTAY